MVGMHVSIIMAYWAGVFDLPAGGILTPTNVTYVEAVCPPPFPCLAFKEAREQWAVALWRAH